MANYKPNSAKSPEDLTERRKEMVYADGYDITDGVTVLTASPDVNETNIPVFGQDDNITGTNVTSATLNISILESNEGIIGFNRLIHNEKPVKEPVNSPTQYKVGDITPVNILILRKSNDNESIVSSRFHPMVTINPAYPEGAADDKSLRAYTGKGGPAREFDGMITADLVQEGESLRNIPYAIPRSNAISGSGIYAVWIEMIEPDQGKTYQDPGIKREPIREPTSAMVLSDGSVSWTDLTSAVSSLSNPTHAHIYYLQSGVTGIPSTNTTIQPEGMRGVIT